MKWCMKQSSLQKSLAQQIPSSNGDAYPDSDLISQFLSFRSSEISPVQRPLQTTPLLCYGYPFLLFVRSNKLYISTFSKLRSVDLIHNHLLSRQKHLTFSNLNLSMNSLKTANSLFLNNAPSVSTYFCLCAVALP